MSKSVSRRSWLSSFVRPLTANKAKPTAGTMRPVAQVIGSHCLAYHHSPCSTCYERCPEEGAITVELGKPTIVADHCTGCGICIDLCPAPVKAIELIQLPESA